MNSIANLTAAELTVTERLRDEYWEMLHNASLFSPVYSSSVGIYQGLPYYLNAQQLVVIGYSLDDTRISVSRRAKSLVAHAVQNTAGLKDVEFWGPDVPDHIECFGFRRSYVQAPSLSNCDVMLSLSGITRFDVRARRDVRRAVRNELTVSIGENKEVTPHHLAVFAKFTSKHSEIDIEEKKYVFCWEKALTAKDSILLNVHNGMGQLTGFAILSTFGARVATYAYGFFDNQCSGTSDIAHAAMIEYCIGRYEWLDLGYSIHRQLLRYKLKWGRTRLIDAPWCVRWSRCSD